MLVQKYGAAVDIAIHAPNRNGDQRNFHAHILATTRRFTNGALSQKTDFDLSDRDRKKKGLGTRRSELESIRAEWADMINQALEKAKLHERVTHKSHAARGLEVGPTIHIGVTATAMERRGIQTERGNFNRMTGGQEQEEKKELVRLERQQQGIQAARQRFLQEKTTRAEAKADAEERERRRKQQEAERARRRQAERAEIEKQYGQTVARYVLPEAPMWAYTRREYGNYLDRLQDASPEQRAEMVKEFQHANRRYEVQQLFQSFSEYVSHDTSISGRQKVRDTMLKEWDSATPERREQMELEAREYVKTHERQRSRGMSMGR